MLGSVEQVPPDKGKIPIKVPGAGAPTDKLLTEQILPALTAPASRSIVNGQQNKFREAVRQVLGLAPFAKGWESFVCVPVRKVNGRTAGRCRGLAVP
jgi:hypothetical protein